MYGWSLSLILNSSSKQAGKAQHVCKAPAAALPRLLEGGR
jgi:hypothetical protein